MESRGAAIAAFASHRFLRDCGLRIACAALLAIAVGAGGCSLFHHDRPTAQQKFVEALERGNGPEANQIWLHMNEQERADWSHSIGMKPNVSKEDIETKLLHHAQQQADQDGTDEPDGSATMSSDVSEGDINSQILEMPGLDVDPNAGSLQNLPGVTGESTSEP